MKMKNKLSKPESCKKKNKKVKYLFKLLKQLNYYPIIFKT